MVGLAKFLLMVGLTLTMASGFSTYFALQPTSVGFIEMSGDEQLIQQAKVRVAFVRDHLVEKISELIVCLVLALLGFFLAGEDRTPRSFLVTLAIALAMITTLLILQSWLAASLYLVGVALVTVACRDQLKSLRNS